MPPRSYRKFFDRKPDRLSSGPKAQWNRCRAGHRQPCPQTPSANHKINNCGPPVTRRLRKERALERGACFEDFTTNLRGAIASERPSDFGGGGTRCVRLAERMARLPRLRSQAESFAPCASISGMRRGAPFVFVLERGSTQRASAEWSSELARRQGWGLKVHAHRLRHACGYALANAGHDTRSLDASQSSGGPS